MKKFIAIIGVTLGVFSFFVSATITDAFTRANTLPPGVVPLLPDENAPPTVAPVAPTSNSSDFVPLAPLGKLIKGSDYTSIPNYLNKVFTIAISVAAMLAVIMLIIHGVEYMTQESGTAKSDHLVGIRSVVLGLILLLLSWIILNVIDPNILKLDLLQSHLSGAPITGPSVSGQSLTIPQQDSQTPGADLAQKCAASGKTYTATCEEPDCSTGITYTCN